MISLKFYDILFQTAIQGDEWIGRYRTPDGVEFTKLTEISTLELVKLPPQADDSDLWFWVKFIKSDGEEVLDMLAERSPQIKKAVGVLKELSADERNRMLYEDREKARRDMASRINGAERKGRQEGSNERAIEIAKNAINMNIDADTI